MWLCPFKTVTEFPAVRNVETAIQFGVFIALFVGLVVVLPFLTKKRTQCGFFCPFGAFQSLFNKINLFEIRFDRAKCVDCTLCQTSCPTVALSKESIREGKTLMNCMKCGACVDVCKKDAAVWHLKGTPVAVKPERARLLFLYGAWALATMFGGSVLANSVADNGGLAAVEVKEDEMRARILSILAYTGAGLTLLIAVVFRLC